MGKTGKLSREDAEMGGEGGKECRKKQKKKNHSPMPIILFYFILFDSTTRRKSTFIFLCVCFYTSNE